MYKQCNKIVKNIDNSKYFAGVVMLLLNIGSKYITIEFSETQEAYLKNTFGRQLLIFSFAWLGTRDIVTAIIVTACFVILADYLLNENSKLCILPKHYHVLTKSIDKNGDGIISDKELDDVIKILNQAKTHKKRIAQHHQTEYFVN